MDWSLFFSFFSAVVSGVLIQIWFSLFDEKYLQPRRNFQITRQKITSALVMYAPEFTNPHELPIGKTLNAPYHEEAYQKLRELSAELEGVIASFYVPDESRSATTLIFARFRTYASKRIYNNLPSYSDMQQTQRHLMGLSNSLFLPAGIVINEDKREQGKRNADDSSKIRELLYSSRGE